MKKIVLLSAILLAVSGCFIGKLYTEKDYFFYEHMTDLIHFYDDMVISREYEEPDKWDLSIDVHKYLRLQQTSLQGEDKALFDAVCAKHGDVNYNKKEPILNHPHLWFFSPDIVYLTIVSDKDFDSDHQAGSSLNDCFVLFGKSMYPKMNPDWTDRIRGGHLLSEVLPHDLEMLQSYSSSRQRVYKYRTDEDLEWSGLAKLCVSRLPESNQVHKLTFTFTVEDGVTYESSIEYDFSNSILGRK